MSEAQPETAGVKQGRDLSLLLLLMAGLLGAYLRIAPVLGAGFPLLDGGLFYTMTSDLIDAGFRLPLVTSYNHLDIPFAYPPLPFYLVGALHAWSGIELLELIRWLPVFFTILTIPAFGLLARRLFEHPAQAALATLCFALLPRSYEWLIMGGGVTRAPAALFYILMAWALQRAFQQRSWNASLLAALFGGLIVLCHPERALHAAATGLLFWLWLDHSRAGNLRALAIGAGSLLLSSPWWLTVLIRHGGQVFFNAAGAAGDRWLFWAPLLQLNFTDETVPLLALLAVIGALLCWKQGQGLLGAWFLVTLLVDPRSAPHILPVQISLLATLTLSSLLIPSLIHSFLSSPPGRGLRYEMALFVYLLVLMLYNGQTNQLALNRLVLSPADREAMTWVQEETPPGSRFLVLDWQESAMLSPLQEWFPALTGRMNIVTIQGREWLTGPAHYNARLESYGELTRCMDEDNDCTAAWVLLHGESYDYVYLALNPLGQVPKSPRLADSLYAIPAYQVSYQSDDVIIFHYLP